jgi:hypothetical protein
VVHFDDEMVDAVDVRRSLPGGGRRYQPVLADSYRLNDGHIGVDHPTELYVVT